MPAVWRSDWQLWWEITRRELNWSQLWQVGTGDRTQSGDKLPALEIKSKLDKNNGEILILGPHYYELVWKGSPVLLVFAVSESWSASLPCGEVQHTFILKTRGLVTGSGPLRQGRAAQRKTWRGETGGRLVWSYEYWATDHRDNRERN